MSDEFLYQLRERPRPEFAEALKAQIFQEQPRSPTARRVRTGLVVLLAAIIIAACAAPQTRTPILRAVTRVVDTTWSRGLPIVSMYQVGGHPRIEVVSPSGEKKVVVIETMSLAEAQQRVPFQIRIPAWVPEGLEMNPLTVIPPEAYGDWIIYAGWRGPYSGGIMFPDTDPGLVPLSLRVEGPNVRFVILEKEVNTEGDFEVKEENIVTPLPPPQLPSVEINGKPVFLIRENWGLPVATLWWMREDDGTRYTLTANLNWVSLEDLIRVAETIR